MTEAPPPTPKLTAGLDLLGRTGAAETQLRWHDDQEPTVWIAVARWRIAHGRPQPFGRLNAWQAAAGHTPEEAVLKLCELVIDGGHCGHCHKPTIFYVDLDDQPMPKVDVLLCAWEWDPELSTYRRGCEGDDR